MSINVSSLLLRNCKVGTLTVELDFENMTTRKRNSLIKQLEGVKKANSEPAATIRRNFKVPFITEHGWSAIPSNSKFWTHLEEAYQLLKVIGIYDAKTETYSMQNIENVIRTKPTAGYIWTYHGQNNPLRLLPITSYVEPIPLDNPIHELIAKLKAGENPKVILPLDVGQENNYKTPKRIKRS